MGYETLMETLLKEGERKRQNLLDQAAEACERIVREAEEEASRLRAEKTRQNEAACRRRRADILTRARMEANRLWALAKNEAMENVLIRAKERLTRWEEDPNNRQTARQFWTRRIETVLEEIPSGPVTVYLYERASKDWEAIVKEKGAVCERLEEPDLWFGFRVSFDNGRKTLTDSFAGRLNKAKGELSVRLGSFLFRNTDRSDLFP